MKKKNSFIYWVIIFALSLGFLIYMTFVFYKSNQTFYAYMMNMFTMIDIIIAIVGLRKEFILPYVNDHRHDYDLKSFVDRDIELKNVIEQINTGKKVIYVSGRTGIGKTLFLHKLIDIIHESKKIIVNSSIYPLYIDLKKGDDVKEAIKSAIQAKEDLNNTDLLKELHKSTKAKIVIILLDNANKHLYLETEEFISTLVSLDDNLIFVISADALEKRYQAVEMGDFTEKEVDKIASIEDVYVDSTICNTIIKKSGGLPSIIRLLIKQLKKTGNIADTKEIEIYIEKICNNLNEKQQDLLGTLAYYSLAENNMSEYVLRKYNCNCTEHNLSELADNGLINYTEKTGSITIQQYLSEIFRTIYEDNRFQICNSLYLMIDQRDKNDKYKLIFLLLSDSAIMSCKELMHLLSSLFAEKKYQFLIYLFELLDDFHRLNKYYDSKDIRKKLLYCYIHSLLELGEYPKAQDYINNSEAWSDDINLKQIDSKLEFDINFDLADMDHFFGNFELAINSYMKLKNYNITDSQLIKCKWAIGHCYRHLGDIYSMQIALDCFKEIIEENGEEKNEYYIRAYQSLILIKLYFNDADYDYEKAFSEMIEFLQNNNKKRVNEILTSRQYAIYHRIILHDNTTALDILYSALDDLEITGIRIKYDYYFEIAEALRHKFAEQANPNGMLECLDYYNKALAFAVKAGDISLECISQIGIILCHIFIGKYNSEDLQKALEICDFCEEKNISYIFNYAYKIKEYLLNDIYLHKQDLDSVRSELMNMNLFIM